MAINSIGRTQADTAGFIPIIWAQRALDVLRARIVLAKVIARDTDYEPGWKGKTLNVGYPGTFTAQSKTEGNPATVQQPTGSTVAVTLSQHKYVDFVIEDWAQAQSNQNLMDRYMNPAIVALAEDLETYLFSFYSSLTGTAVGTAGTNIARATITAARVALNNAKAPLEDRTLIISPKDEGALLDDTTLQTYFAFRQTQGITSGVIGNIDGFNIMMSQLVPVVAGTPNDTKNLAIHKDALLLATRPFGEPPADSGVKSAVTVDDVSGLSIRMQYQDRIDYRGMYIGFDLLYGAVPLRPTLGSVVHS
jgi:hypothetical protein